MPQRSSLKVQEPTSLRRSPRLLHLSISPKTPNPTSKITRATTPISTSSRKPKKGATNSARSVVSLKENGNRSGRCGKSANGSVRKSNLGTRVEGKRQSSRFCKEVTSEINGNDSCNGRKVDGSIDCINSRSSRGSKKRSFVGTNDLAMQYNVVDCSVTPVRVGEMKYSGFNEKGSDIEISGSPIFSNFERRITRSCTRKLGGNVEVKKIENSKLKGSDLFNSRACGNGVRKIVRPVRGTRGKGKVVEMEGKSSDFRRVVVCGLGIARDESLPCLATPGGGGRRRRNLKDRCDVDYKADCSFDQVDVNFERRITRSASKLMARNADMVGQDSGVTAKSGVSKGDSRITMQEKQKKRELPKCRRTGLRKRVQQNAIKPLNARLEEDEIAMRDIVSKKKGSHDSVEQDIAAGANLVGVKRKRKQAVSKVTDQGWTLDQEVALQRAYFTAKPSPHFWKKVTKLVPGKSAQECFDKVHSLDLTPLSTRQSSRINKQKSPSEISLMSNKLLGSVETKSKKSRKTKCKSHVARRNVRHLLDKYCEDSEPDLFSVLEPAVNPGVEALKLNDEQLTPKLSSKFRSLSSSGHKKPLSRLSGLSASPLASPPVLKKVKNMALHEKYIDQLHIREGKRKMVSARHLKAVHRQNGGPKNPALMKDVIKAAKAALVSDARDVIEKFRHSQENIMDACTDFEEVPISDDDNENDMLR